MFEGDSTNKNEIYERIKKELKEVGIEFEGMWSVQQNPEVELVRKWIEFCGKDENAVDGVIVIEGRKYNGFWKSYMCSEIL